MKIGELHQDIPVAGCSEANGNSDAIMVFILKSASTPGER